MVCILSLELYIADTEQRVANVHGFITGETEESKFVINVKHSWTGRSSYYWNNDECVIALMIPSLISILGKKHKSTKWTMCTIFRHFYEADSQ